MATWLLDLAETKLAGTSRNGDDASVMFGVPTTEQHRRVIDAAQEALDLITRAESAASAAVARLEALLLDPSLDPDRAAATARQIEPLLSTLVETELGRRIPALRTRASALAALEEDSRPGGPTRRSEALKLLNATPEPDKAAQVRARLLAAAILLRAVETPQHQSTARRQLEWITSAIAPDPQGNRTIEFSSIDWIRLQMGLVRVGMNDAALKLPCPGRGKDWLVDLLLAESALAHTVAGSGATPRQREAATRQMLDVARRYSEGSADLDSPDAPSPLRATVYSKLGRTPLPPALLIALDPEAALARAWFLRDAAIDKKLDAEATMLLTSLADREDAPVPLRARALWVLASDSAAPRPFLLRLIALPSSPRLARPAAVQLLEESSPAVDDAAPCGIKWTDDTLRRDAAAALSVLLSDRPEDAELRRLSVAAALGGAIPTGPELDSAMTLARNAPPGDADRPKLAECINAALARALTSPLDSAARIELLGRAEEWFTSGPAEDSARARTLWLERVDLAWAAKSVPAATLATQLEPLLETPLDLKGSPGRGRLRVLLGTLLRASGQHDRGITYLRSVTDEFEPDARNPDPARADARRAFWNAWAEMLEALRRGEAGTGQDATDGESARAQQARRLRDRLEILDPELGGEPWAGRIRAAADGNSK